MKSKKKENKERKGGGRVKIWRTVQGRYWLSANRRTVGRRGRRCISSLKGGGVWGRWEIPIS